MNIFTEEQQQRLQGTGRILALVGAAIMAVSAYLAWSYGPRVLDNMTFWFGPSPLQFAFLAFAVFLAVLVVAGTFGQRKGTLARVGWKRAAKTAATTAVLFVLGCLFAITLALGGLINIEAGGWVALAGALIAWLGTRMLPAGPEASLERAAGKSWLQILAIVVVMAAALFAAAYILEVEDSGAFLVVIIGVFGLVMTLNKLGLATWFRTAANHNRQALILAAFVVAFAFPFTQGGSDANMSIAVQVLIFAGTALGLNIVVGLAGLLDLGYIAFLGAGAFTAAVLSKSAFATFLPNFKPPFILVMLISGCIAGIFGLIIGSPTLRVSGDYLAIVTLAFGEIFRIGMNNLDGSDGPDITHGSNGIPGIPNLNLFGFDFGESHTILGVLIGRFANYYWLMLLVIGLIILVFVNLNNSRIGRGWVAIREDEKAAEAMGVNTFGLKLLAFAGGAFLAGLAGTVKAHVDVSVTPDQYIFLESAFLLAAVVLGGMGTVLGVLVGATILKLLPEKLRIISDARLLAFGLLLVLMMRFRPEGLIASERRQLEFHEEDQELADQVEETIDLFHPEVTADAQEKS
ncbi:branched-chain amino acid ABC transporter permease [Granulicoccus sp. GXG6511]|uniref:branched-chain amino acid ABC transporter permease n=1 Tax=Granulicoccus sp. GXG6511 TaxID=3381351 RepID=UPI003D7E8DFF